MSQTNTVARNQAAAKPAGNVAIRRANRNRLLRPVLMAGGV